MYKKIINYVVLGVLSTSPLHAEQGKNRVGCMPSDVDINFKNNAGIVVVEPIVDLAMQNYRWPDHDAQVIIECSNIISRVDIAAQIPYLHITLQAGRTVTIIVDGKVVFENTY